MYTVQEVAVMAASGALGGALYWAFAQRNLILARAKAVLGRR